VKYSYRIRPASELLCERQLGSPSLVVKIQYWYPSPDVANGRIAEIDQTSASGATTVVAATAELRTLGACPSNAKFWTFDQHVDTTGYC
jgi:hypothetical protein